VRCLPMRLVLDTNIWLDWLVFADPSVGPIRTAVAAGSAVVIMDSACDAELERALGYPFRGEVAGQDKRDAWLAEVRGIIQRFDVSPAPDAVALPACRDPDDQKFLELARDCGADWLITRDKALLACARRGSRPLPFAIGTPQRFLEVAASG
jgi:putative PIN family toxin of toxin-antitoxin system